MCITPFTSTHPLEGSSIDDDALMIGVERGRLVYGFKYVGVGASSHAGPTVAVDGAVPISEVSSPDMYRWFGQSGGYLHSLNSMSTVPFGNMKGPGFVNVPSRKKKKETQTKESKSVQTESSELSTPACHRFKKGVAIAFGCNCIRMIGW